MGTPPAGDQLTRHGCPSDIYAGTHERAAAMMAAELPAASDSSRQIEEDSSRSRGLRSLGDLAAGDR
jgi:hypothetical protein